MKWFALGAKWFALAVLAGLAGFAQTAARPAFAVTSVKLLKDDDLRGVRPRMNCSEGGVFSSSGLPLKYVIEWAYDIRTPFTVPGWADESGERYLIEGKPEGAATNDECRLMVRGLLESRFALKVRRETKEAPVYALVVSKGGPKIHAANADGSAGDGSAGDGVWMRGRKVSAKGWEAWMIASTLATEPGVERPVIDKTGLTGLFEFRLNYSMRPGDDQPGIFTAVQEQLGLKLEPTRGPVESVVIGHLAKPSVN